MRKRLHLRKAKERTRNRSAGMTIFFALAASAIVSVLLLLIADFSSTRGSLDLSRLLVGSSFIAVMMALTLTSISKNMSICFQMTYIYLAIYLLLPGYSHLSVNIFPFFDASYSRAVREQGAFIVFLFCMLLISCQFLFQLRSQRSIRNQGPEPSVVVANPRFIIFFWVATMIAMAVFLALGGFRFAFSMRGTEAIMLDSAGAAFGSTVPRAIGTAALAYATAQIRILKPPHALVVLIGFAVPAFILNFPPAIPRSTLFGLILFCLFSALNFKTAKARTALSLLFVFGAVIAMPIADGLVRGGQSISDLASPEILNRYFETGDYDGLQSLNNAVIYRQESGLQHGRQLAASILFFVPRSVWPDKAVPTGQAAAEMAGFSFTNVSMPLPGEFFADFGYVGVIVGTILFAWAISMVDRWINRRWTSHPEARYIAGAFVGYSTIVLRGSLGAVIGPAATIALCCLVVCTWGFPRSKRLISPRRRLRVLRVPRRASRAVYHQPSS